MAIHFLPLICGHFRCLRWPPNCVVLFRRLLKSPLWNFPGAMSHIHVLWSNRLDKNGYMYVHVVWLMSCCSLRVQFELVHFCQSMPQIGSYFGERLLWSARERICPDWWLVGFEYDLYFATQWLSQHLSDVVCTYAMAKEHERDSILSCTTWCGVFWCWEWLNQHGSNSICRSTGKDHWFVNPHPHRLSNSYPKGAW